MKRLFLMTLMGCLALLTHGQYTLQGKVKNADGQPLDGVNVSLKNSYKGAFTNSDGVFKLTLSEGDYRLNVTHIGYDSLQRSISIEKDRDISFILKQQDVFAEEVIIRSSRAGYDDPVAHVNLEKQEIERVNLGKDIPQVISRSPSVVSSSYAGNGMGYTTYRIRGTDMNRINVTVNGIPLNDAESHGVWWVDLPDLASSVDNMQIQRGVGVSTHGSGAFGASINIKTNQLNKEPYAELNSSYGSFNTSKATFKVGSGLINDQFAFDARVSRLYSDGFVDRAYSDLNSLYMSGTYLFGNSSLRVNVMTGKEKTYLSWGGVPKEILDTNRTYNPFTYDNATDNYQQDHVQLFYFTEFSDYLVMNATLHYTKGNGYYEQFEAGQHFSAYGLDNAYPGGDTIRQSDLVTQKWLDNDYYGLIWSLNYNKDRVRSTLGTGWSRYDGDHFGEIIRAEYAAHFDQDYRWYDGTGIKDDMNVFGKLKYQLTPHLSLHGDLQYRFVAHDIDGIDDDLRDITQRHEYHFVNPKVGVYYELAGSHTLFAAYGIANREPNRSNYTDAPTEETPRPERLFDHELGYKFQGSRVELATNFYYMKYHDQLVLTGEINNVGAAIMTNAENSYRAGIELIGGFKIADPLTWEFNATFSRNKVKDFTAYVDNWSTGAQEKEHLGLTDLSFSPDVIAGSMIRYDHRNWLSLFVDSKYVGKQYLDNTSSEERSLDPYFVNDLMAQVRFNPGFMKEIMLKVQLYNIFDVEYESDAWVYRYILNGEENLMTGFYPQAGRHVMAGLSVKF